MIRVLLVSLCCASAVIGWNLSRAVAQDDDVFGDTSDLVDQNEPAPKADKAKQPKETLKEKRAPKKVVSPALAELRQSIEDTDAGLLRGTILAWQIGEPEESKELAKRYLALKPTDEQLSQFLATWGSDKILAMQQDKAIAPEGAQIAKQLLEGAWRHARSPVQIRENIGRLGSASGPTKSRAFLELEQVWEESIPAIFSALRTEKNKSSAAALRSALVKMKRLSEPAMLTALAHGDSKARYEAALLLGRMKSERASELLLGLPFGPDKALREASVWALQRLDEQVPTKDVAESRLFRKTKRLLTIDRGFVAPDEAPTAWEWIAESKSLHVANSPYEDQQVDLAFALSRELLRLAPRNREYQDLAVMASLERARRRLPLQERLDAAVDPVWKVSAKLSPERMLGILRAALDQNRPWAAIGALEALQATGSVALLDESHGAESEVIRAARSGNPRVRYVAIETIAKWDPQRPFAGSATYADGVAYFMKASGSRRVVVAHPNRFESLRIAGLFSAHGFMAEGVTTGHAAVEQAKLHPDIELCLLYEGIDHLNVIETVQLLRKDFRSQTIPIVVLQGTDEMAHRAPIAISRDNLATMAPVPYNEETARFVLQQGLKLTPREAMPHLERVLLAENAGKWGARILSDRQRYRFLDSFALETAALESIESPTQLENAIPILGGLGTSRCQAALADLLERRSVPQEVRARIATALTDSFRRHGIMLTRREVSGRVASFEAFMKSAPETTEYLSPVTLDLQRWQQRLTDAMLNDKGLLTTPTSSEELSAS